MTEKLLVGVDLGGTTIKLAFLTLEGEIVTKWEVPTNKEDSGKWIASDIAKTIREKKEELNKEIQFVGLGMGVPGPVDLETGVVISAVNIGWTNFPIKEELEKETGLRVSIDNDANVAALGEMWRGAGQGAKDLVCVTLGTGVGGGVIANGNILHGKNCAAGEIGHISTVLEGGYQCNCGKTGCLETIASATGIARLANERCAEATEETPLVAIYKQNGGVTAKDVFDTVEEDAIAQHVVEHVTTYLGFALGNLANALNPEKIVLGGGVSKAGDKLLQPVAEKVRQYTFSVVRDNTELAIATLGNDAGVIGAAWLAKQN